MRTCGVSRRGERISRLKIKEEGCEEEDEGVEVESEEEEAMEEEEVSKTGLGEEGEEDEGEDEGVVEEEVEIGIETKTNCDIVQLIPFPARGISYCIQKVIQLLFCQLVSHLPDSFTSTNSKPQNHGNAEQRRLMYQYQGIKSSPVNLQLSCSSIIAKFFVDHWVFHGFCLLRTWIQEPRGVKYSAINAK